MGVGQGRVIEKVAQLREVLGPGDTDLGFRVRRDEVNAPHAASSSPEAGSSSRTSASSRECSPANTVARVASYSEGDRPVREQDPGVRIGLAELITKRRGHVHGRGGLTHPAH